MRTLRSIAILAGAIVLVASAMAQVAAVKKAELPQPVLSAIERMVPGSTVGSASKKIEKDGTVRYHVNVVQGDEHIRVDISPEGKLYERWDLNPKFAELPAPAKKKIEFECMGDPDHLLKVTPGEGQPYYKFGINKSVEADGSRRKSAQDDLGSPKEISHEEVPQPVLNAVEKLDPGTNWSALRFGGNNARYGTSYMILEKDKKYFVLSPEGKLDESWDFNVKVSDMPRPVRKIVERITTSGERTLVKVTAPGKKPYYRVALNGVVAEDGHVMVMQEEEN